MILTKGIGREVPAIGIIYIGTLIHGYNTGYSSSTMPNILWENLKSNGSYFGLPSINTNTEELSWFASCTNLGQIIGGLPGGYIGGALGPRRAILISFIPTIMGWIMIAFGPYVEILIVGRVLAGVGGAFYLANSVMLIQQLSSHEMRGFFLSLRSFVVSLGVLLSFLSGAFIHWRLAALVPVCLASTMFLGFLWLKESPVWLLGHHGEAAARETLQWIRVTDKVNDELEEIRNVKDNSGGLSMVQALKNFRRPDIYKPIILIVLCLTFGTLTGNQALLFYTVEIFMNSGIEIDKNIAAIIVASTTLVAGIFAPIVVAKFTRRKSGVYSSLVLMLAMVILGTYMYMKKMNILIPGLSSIPVICLCVFTFSYGAGASPLQNVWYGELLPPEYKIISGLIVSEANLMVFFVTKLFPLLESTLQPHGTYWLFSVMCLLNLILCGFVMPETKGLSYSEVRGLFLKEETTKTRKESIPGDYVE